jgi:glycosyltransferase involved in cell wall biosynthesis
VVDGSTDGSDAALRPLEASELGLRVIRLAINQGKGAAVLHAIRLAAAAGLTHVLVMDSDGQHPANAIPSFMAASAASPGSMVLGQPVFGPDAPLIRVLGRRLSNGCAWVETLGAGIGDSLFGFRIYPVAPLLAVMARHRWMRRFDFDPEAVVRLVWYGVQPVRMVVPVRYLTPTEGGVSHFHYGRDNLLLAWMHARLLLGLLGRLCRGRLSLGVRSRSPG